MRSIDVNEDKKVADDVDVRKAIEYLKGLGIHYDISEINPNKKIKPTIERTQNTLREWTKSIITVLSIVLFSAVCFFCDDLSDQLQSTLTAILGLIIGHYFGSSGGT